MNIWKINRNKINGAGAGEHYGTGKEGELIIKLPSIYNATTEVGGGLIYWNGKGYSCFHQTC